MQTAKPAKNADLDFLNFTHRVCVCTVSTSSVIHIKPCRNGETMIDLEEIDKFKLFLKKKGLSEHTHLIYCSAVRQYYSLYSQITLENLIGYKAYLVNHCPSNTVNSRITGINRYLDYLESEGVIHDMGRLLKYRLPYIKFQQRSFLDTIISEHDYEHLKEELKASKNMYWYFVIRFLTASGARISELVQIKTEHLELGYMDLCSKGCKIRRIFFPEVLCKEALSWFDSHGVKSGFIFLNQKGKQITPRGINFQLKKIAIQYGVNPDTVYPHSFRHRFAKNFLNRYNDISLLADLMGHDSIETTRIYLTQSSKEQKQLIDEVVTW